MVVNRLIRAMGHRTDIEKLRITISLIEPLTLIFHCCATVACASTGRRPITRSRKAAEVGQRRLDLFRRNLIQFSPHIDQTPKQFFN